ncbi:MAG: hypothetical protein JEY71_15350 [Sphaerochaeta sp.]|nr:hypothetical protein [Sphaerochaeta sp.]
MEKVECQKNLEQYNTAYNNRNPLPDYLEFTPRIKKSSQAKTFSKFDGQLQLGRLLEMNEEISKVSLLHQQLRALYEIRDEMVMRTEWERWLCMCEQSGFRELLAFASKKSI